MKRSPQKKQKSNGFQERARGSDAGPAILFDLDGTLIDSVYEHILAWRDALRKAHIAAPNWRIHRRVGMSGKLMLRELLRELGYRVSARRTKALEEGHRKNFDRKIAQLETLPGARELLRHLSEKGVRWAIGTGGDEGSVKKMVKLLGVPSTVPVITGDDVAEAKPEPDIFVVAAQRLGVKVSDCVIVGDSVWDLLGARRTKALGVGLLTGGYGREELERAGAYRVYENPANLLEHLEEIGVRTH
jgi:HAD superfamily hydrolase (TIGR01549 family)